MDNSFSVELFIIFIMAKYSLGVKFNKGIAEVDGKKFDGVIPLYTKKGILLMLIMKKEFLQASLIRRQANLFL